MKRSLLALPLLLLASLAWPALADSAAPTAGADSASAACRVLQAPASLEGIVQSQQGAPSFRRGNAHYVPLAGFSIAARVLARADYSDDRLATHSPIDLALGWGPMAEAGMAEKLEISQGERWYRYRWGRGGPPIEPTDIVQYSANMHMVPVGPQVAQALARMRAGELVRLDGWLIRIESDEGWSWQSSLVREDTGIGSCELLLVCSVGPR